MRAFPKLTGLESILGHGALPKASFAASSLQKRVKDLKVEEVLYANGTLLKLKELMLILFYDPNLNTEDPVHLAFLNAIQGKSAFGQSGFIFGTYIGNDKSGIFHAIDWIISKQKRVSFHHLMPNSLLLLRLPTKVRTLLKEYVQ